MKRIVLLLLACVFLFGACKEDYNGLEISSPATSFTHRIPLIWNQLYLDVERYCPGYKPPVSARNIGYINLIAYEAIVHGSKEKYQSFSAYYPGLFIREPEPEYEYNWEVCLNAAYERAFELYFPTAPAEQQFHMLEIGSDLRTDLQSRTTPAIYNHSAQYGRYIAETVYAWSAEDHWGHEAYLHNTDPSYLPPAGTGLWKPTFPDYQPALLPHWGNVRTFAAQASDVTPPPPTFSTDPNAPLFAEALETRNLVNEIKAGGKQEDFWIAEFWSDDCPILTFSPAGRWISITNQIIAIERLDMLETVVVYAKLSMALSDAGIKCWQEKYKYNFLRPVDYIRAYLNDPNWNTVMCPDGSGGYYTPSFPTYPSGHATFSAAAAVVLESVFGSNYRFTDRSHEGRTEFKGTPRTFNSIRSMALENAYSRIPLGVHFRSDAEAGTALGDAVGQRVVALPWR